MSTRFWVAALIYPMVQAVMFGAGLLVALAFPAAAPQGAAIVAVILLTAGLSVPAAWMIAPRMMLRHGGGRSKQRAAAAEG